MNDFNMGLYLLGNSEIVVCLALATLNYCLQIYRAMPLTLTELHHGTEVTCDFLLILFF